MVLESRHQFVYGKNGNKRESFLRRLADENPLVIDENVPCAVYMDEFSISSVEQPKNIDILTLRILKEYLNFSIAYNILSKVIYDVSSDVLREREEAFLSRLNKIYSTNISSLNELLNVLNDTRCFYKNVYIHYLQTGEFDVGINELPICFLDVCFFIRELKKLLNNNSYFALIFDQQERMPVIFQRLINNFISGRINSDISIKVACDPQEWNSYVDTNGTLVEYTHDYGKVALDDSLKEYTRRMKDKYMHKFEN